MSETPQTITEMNGDDVVAAYKSGRIDFSNLDFRNYLEISNCNLDDIMFRNCWLDGTFENVSMRNAIFANCCIKPCRFINCDLTFANFKGSEIDAIEFSNCKLTHACFDNARAYSNFVPQGVLPSWLGTRECETEQTDPPKRRSSAE